MAITKCDLEEILKDLPSKWRDVLINILIQIQKDRQSVDCDKVKQCQSVTQLSEFYQNDTEICITFTDEHGLQIERCFNIENILNETLAGIDPICVTTPTIWNTMTYTEKFQALVDTMCNCCPSTSTTSTTTVAEETTTTTTTVPETTTTTTTIP